VKQGVKQKKPALGERTDGRGSGTVGRRKCPPRRAQGGRLTDDAKTFAPSGEEP